MPFYRVVRMMLWFTRNNSTKNENEKRSRKTHTRTPGRFDNLWTYIGYFRGHFPNDWSANWGPMVGDRESSALVYWWYWRGELPVRWQPDARRVDAPLRLGAPTNQMLHSTPPSHPYPCRHQPWRFVRNIHSPDCFSNLNFAN